MSIQWKVPGLQKPSKYKNRKVVKNGETFDSVKEYERHLVLLDMQKRGEIRHLERQPEFVLEVNGTLICRYRGDWRYWDHKAGRAVVEDAKGFQTADFRIKFKLAMTLYPQIDWRLS